MSAEIFERHKARRKLTYIRFKGTNKQNNNELLNCF